MTQGKGRRVTQAYSLEIPLLSLLQSEAAYLGRPPYWHHWGTATRESDGAKRDWDITPMTNRPYLI